MALVSREGEAVNVRNRTENKTNFAGVVLRMQAPFDALSFVVNNVDMAAGEIRRRSIVCVAGQPV